MVRHVGFFELDQQMEACIFLRYLTDNYMHQGAQRNAKRNDLSWAGHLFRALLQFTIKLQLL